MGSRELVERRLSEIAGLVPGPSRRGHSNPFFLGETEIAHFHGDHRIDIRLTKEWILQRRAQGTWDDRVRTHGPNSHWGALELATESDVELAVALVREAARTNAPR